MSSVDFATFVYSGDYHRLYAPGQFRRQVESNRYKFDHLIVVHQKLHISPILEHLGMPIIKPIIVDDNHIDKILARFGIDLSKPQYESDTDKHHTWKYHCVNHLTAALVSEADYIVFADNDCWMLNPINWVTPAIKLLENNKDCFIVSPNDGEPERKTLRMSQQMFLVKREDFIKADFNQPEWDGNVNVPGGPFPQYWALLEGRMELYCKTVNRYRYVLDSKYRYWHHNRLTKDNLYELDPTKY